MFKSFTRIAALAALVSLPVGAQALSISVSSHGKNLSAAQSAFNSTRSTFEDFFVTENFESFSTGEKGSGLDTGSIGVFNTLGGKGTGSSAVGTGTNVAVRDENSANTGGRINTSAGANDTQYLDSNDTRGMVWKASDQKNGRAFDRLLFTLTDPADAGQTLTISSTDENGKEVTFVETIAPPQKNGGIFNILISFSETVKVATVSLEKGARNDGFGIDNATIGAVPLPAAAWLLLGASGALVLGKRRNATRRAA